eukprot:TRINITY_DN4555_c0_g2_i1.p1 TRINITY_DN4555_c0_g2~~TRINITY_DN4555_c0_g2_i1.p1  ORF type:complete len:1523 (+),score=257.41 TRINITY_DN4555_c0_g2_i1:548-5116(+)
MSAPESSAAVSSACAGIIVTPYPQEQGDDASTSSSTAIVAPSPQATNTSPSKRKPNKKKKGRKKAKSAISSDGIMRPQNAPTKPPKKTSPLLAPMSEEEVARLSHTDRVKRWFCLMKLEERQQIVSIIDPSLSDLLLSMDQKLTKEGHGLFYEVGESLSLEAMMLGPPGMGSSSSSRNRASSLSTSSVATNQRLQLLRAASGRNKSHSTSSSSSPRGKKGGAAGSSQRQLAALKFFDDFFMGREIKRPDREENFCFLKDARLSEYFTINTLLRSDEDLRQAVRLCDTTQYLDTITLASSLLRGTTAARFFRAMMIASRGKFLETPCKLVYDSKAKKWSPEQPGWFTTMGYYTFGTYLAQKIETILWMRYWRAFRIDPRKDISSPGSSSISPALLASILDDAAGGATRFQKQLLSKIHLVHYLQRLSPSDKKGIILNIGKAVKEVVRENLTSTNYPHWLSILLTFATPAPRMLSNLDLSSSTTPLSKMNNEGEFVELVFFSPLPRADTGMDLVLRRIGVFLQTSYTNKLSTDLILGEEMEKGSGKSSKKKHDSRSGSAKAASSKSSQSSVSSSTSTSSSSGSTSSSSSSQSSAPVVVESTTQPTPTKSALKNSGGSSKPSVISGSPTASPSAPAPIALPLVPEHSTASTIASNATDSDPVAHKTSPPAKKRSSASLTVSFGNQSTPRNVPRFGLSHEAPEQREREEAFIHIQRRAESDTDEDSSGPWQTPGPRSSRLSGSYHGAQAHRRKAKDAEFPLPSRNSGRSTVARPLDLATTTSRRIQVLKWPALSAAQSASFGRPKASEPSPSESASTGSPSHSSSPSPRSAQEQHEKRGRTMSQPLATSSVASTAEHAASAPTTPVPSPRGWATVSAPSTRTSQSAGSSTIGDERGRRPRRPSADAAPSSWRNAVAPVSPPQATRATGELSTIPRAKSQELDLQPVAGMLPPTKSKSHGKLDSKHVRTKSNPNSTSVAASNPPLPPPSAAAPTSVSPSASSTSVISSSSLAPGMVHHNWNTRRSNPQYGRYAYLAQQSTMLAARSRGGRHAQHVYPSGSISGTATPMRLDSRSDSGDGERRRSHSPPPRFRSPYDTAQYALPQDAEFYVLDKEHRYAPGGFLPFWPVYTSQSLPIPIHAGGPSPASSPSMSPSSSSASSASSFTAMINLGVAQTQAAHPFMAGLAFGMSPQSSIIPCGAAVRFELPIRDEVTTQRLHTDILSFCKQVDILMEPKQAQLKQTFALISSLASQLWPSSSCRVELYGSYATGLSIPSSDVDVVICGVGSSEISPLSLLESALKTQPWVRPDSVHSIDSASVPVIKMVSCHGDLPVDITFEELAVRHTGTAARDKVNAFVHAFPHMRPLTVVLKQLLQNNNLNNAWIGGLSSYCLVLMIVSFVQAYHPTAANLGAALLDFLDVYGQVFVYDRMYIAVKTENSSLPNHSYGLALENLPESEGPLAPLSIIDPVRENNVLGKQTDSMFIVKMLFQNLFVGLDQHYSSPHFEPGKLHKLISDTKPTSAPGHSS